MKKMVRIGYIGLGRRGTGVLKACISEMSDVTVVGICDWDESKMDCAVKILEEKGKPTPYKTTDYRKLLTDESIDAIMIMTGWNSHVQLAKDSVLAGKYTAVEVGCAYDLSECFELVEAYEKTGAPLMMLENACYGRRELMMINVVRQGLFGEIVHAKGGYMHYLPEEDLFKADDVDMTHYRVKEYVNRNCEQYPTHELGPISKVLGINRGNRMVKLTSVASKACGLKDYAKKHLPEDSFYYNAQYKQGDIVNTIITCANGETILLTLDTTLPRPYYSRDFTIRGTKGMFAEERKVFYLEGMEEGISFNEEEAFAKYDHPLHAEYSKLEAKGAHGGLDWLTCRGFIESVKNGTDTPIDAYDTAAWMAIAPLSEMSIQKGGAPVDFPDFTKGKWFRREPAVRNKYSLDIVVEDPTTPIFP